MLAAQCVCSLLQAEHAVIRQTLVTLDEMLQAQAWWQPGASLTRLSTLMAFLKSFEEGSHRPKEHDHLLPAMRGRSPEADRLIAALQDTQARTGGLLRHAVHVLDRVAQGDSGRVGELAGLLRQHRAELLQQIDDEDTLLLAMARQLLGDEEWSRIASALSRMPAHSAAPFNVLSSNDESGPDEVLLRRAAARTARGGGPELRLR